MTDLWVLEWSQRTNNFHIQSLAHSLASMQAAFLKNSPNDYKIIMVGDKDVCHRMADTHRDKLLKRASSAT